MNIKEVLVFLGIVALLSVFLVFLVGCNRSPPPPCTGTDECSYRGQKECAGTTLKTCGDLDGDGCLEWDTTPCIECLMNGANNATCIKCVDSDGGVNYLVTGTTKGWDQDQYVEHTDYCTNGVEVYEGSCVSGIVPYVCEKGCQDGICLGGESCTDSDGGNIVTVKGYIHGILNGGNSFSWWDECSGPGNNRITERICVGNNPSVQYLVCPANFICVEGVCQSTVSNQTNETCTDSDGGTNFLVKGVTKGLHQGVYVEHTDYCTNSMQVYEAGCVSGTVQYSAYVCEQGCQDGICLGGASCTDSDGGNITTVKGYTHGIQEYGGNNSFLLWDECSGPGNNRITERICTGNYHAVQYLVCQGDYICADGACKSPSGNQTNST